MVGLFAETFDALRTSPLERTIAQYTPTEQRLQFEQQRMVQSPLDYEYARAMVLAVQLMTAMTEAMLPLVAPLYGPDGVLVGTIVLQRSNRQYS